MKKKPSECLHMMLDRAPGKVKSTVVELKGTTLTAMFECSDCGTLFYEMTPKAKVAEG